MCKLANFLILLLGFSAVACNASHRLEAISCNGAPKAIGPYSHAVRTGNLIYTSGQVGLSPVTNTFAGDDIKSQCRQALDNLAAVVRESGSDMAHVVKVTIYLKDLNDFAAVNDIYKDYFPDLKPARSTVQVARLPKDALIEIDCVAAIK